ncbi:Methyltransferase domain-containing protein [Shimia gijangensis]|uniref:Methyltransferase domain-containing protein n=1 Tax=Shimia gijangensis TaxID=1470563 RepID=A0A1M6NC61_9RHOB|nr:class I SAM-dependent methyltransferase [Shimia gijangensis]SHJ93299.1 Methyltransferase domain-containing protein [Shimia gijangensis]
MWEEKFSTSEGYVFGTDPALFLQDHANYLTSGDAALVLADGEGRNSVFLAEQGLDVTAQEFAPTAIERARALAKARNVAVEIEQSNIFTRPWRAETFDLVAGIFIQFAVPDERRDLFENIKGTVKPGGLVMLHGYTPKQLEFGTGGPPFAENMYTEVILRAAFVGWEILECREYDREVQEGSAHSGMSALIDFVARKPSKA